MAPFLQEAFGNPSSLHWFGQQARAAVEEARGDVAALLGAQPSEIVFTGSGTEADNMALRGITGAAKNDRRKLVYSAIEHHAVMNTAKGLAEQGWAVEVARAGQDGTVDLADLEAKVDERTALVAVMLANNETGVIQPLEQVVAISRKRGALIHCDAVQAAGKILLDVKGLDVDTLAISAHKLYGPKGVGALYVKRGTRMKSLLQGGSQERNRRAGTENVAAIVGLGRAASLARQATDDRRLGELRDRLESKILSIPGAVLNGTGPRVPNTSNISFTGVEAEALLMALDLEGIAVSTGAACAAGAVEPSHVLKGMGLPTERVQASLRFSLGRGTDQTQVDRVFESVAAAVEKHRSRSRPYARAAR